MKIARHLLFTYIILLSVFTLFIILVHAIPTRWVVGNVSRSADDIMKEGIFWKVGNMELFKIDNMTDCMMINMNADVDDAHVVRSAMINEYGKNFTGARGYYGMAASTKELAIGGRQAMHDQVDYGRYWNGYQVIVRPLLLLFHYHQIRVINYICLLALLLAVVWAMLRRYRKVYALLFLVSLLLINFPIVPLAIQFSTCFYIAFSGMLAVMLFSKKGLNNTKAIVLFFVIGALTSYLDFLTTPQITLGFPLLLCLLDKRIKQKYRYILSVALSWVAGYALLWASKWLMAYLLVGVNVFDSAVESMKLRVSDSVVMKGNSITIPYLFRLMEGKLFGVISPVVVLLAILALLAAVSLFIYRYRVSARRFAYMLVVASIVPVWYCVMKNHTVQHIFFTWRAIVVTVYSLLLYIYFILKTEHHE